MQTVLIVITLASLILTIVLGAVLVRLMRQERQRSAARIDALREMADAAAYEQEVAAVADPLDFDLVPAADGDAVPDLFTRPEARSAWPQRALVGAAIALVIFAAGLAMRTLPSRPATTSSAHTQPVAAPTGLLELLSLDQAQEGGSLRITGLVQNPRDGAMLSKVRATALLFAADGTFLASGGAALDFTVLRPGDESGFVITVPVTAPVARYRVGFRTEDGKVIGHIDRRSAGTMAQSGATPAAAPRRSS
jgi:hypothetical protein